MKDGETAKALGTKVHCDPRGVRSEKAMWDRGGLNRAFKLDPR